VRCDVAPHGVCCRRLVRQVQCIDRATTFAIRSSLPCTAGRRLTRSGAHDQRAQHTGCRCRCCNLSSGNTPTACLERSHVADHHRDRICDLHLDCSGPRSNCFSSSQIRKCPLPSSFTFELFSQPTAEHGRLAPAVPPPATSWTGRRRSPFHVCTAGQTLLPRDPSPRSA